MYISLVFTILTLTNNPSVCNVWHAAYISEYWQLFGWHCLL